MTNKGITLIALVITIVLLLILAGITISALTGNNGLFNKTKLAADMSKYESAKETINLKIAYGASEFLAEQSENLYLKHLAEFMSNQDEVEVLVTKYYETAKKLDEITIPSNVEGFLVKDVRQPQYEFFIGLSCKIEKVSIDNGVTLVDIDEFEKNKFGINLEDSTNKDVSTTQYDKWETLRNLAELDKNTFIDLKSIITNSEAISTIFENNEAKEYLINSTEIIMPSIFDNKNATRIIMEHREEINEIQNEELKQKWLYKMANSESAEKKQINSLTNKNYAVSAQYVYNDSYLAEYAMDGKNGTNWVTKDYWDWENDDTTNCWYKVEFNNKVLLSQYEYYQCSADPTYYNFNAIELYGVRDDGTEILLNHNNDVDEDYNEKHTMDIQTNELFSTFKLKLTRGGTYGIGISEMNFIGIEF